jgi:ribosomal protein L11 methyltransferase
MALADDLTAALQPGGYAILSGILNEQADEVWQHYAQFGTNLDLREVIGDWTTLTLVK